MTIRGMRPLRALAATLLVTVLVVGCGGGGETSEPEADTRSFQADNGSVEIPTDPERIVTIGSQALFLDIGVEPVGMNHLTDRDVAAWLTDQQRKTEEASVDIGSPPNVDYEKIASLEPDLIAVHIPAQAWNSKRVDPDRLASIAPTVFIEISNVEWEKQGARIADAVGRTESFEKDKAEYEATSARVGTDNKAVIDANTFAVLNAWGDPGTFSYEYSDSYCSYYASKAGLRIEAAPRQGVLSEARAIERLSDLTGATALLYPLGPDGQTIERFRRVTDSNNWKALPQVRDGKAQGVRCNSTLTYPSRTMSLKSLDEALKRLASAG